MFPFARSCAILSPCLSPCPYHPRPSLKAAILARVAAGGGGEGRLPRGTRALPCAESVSIWARGRSGVRRGAGVAARRRGGLDAAVSPSDEGLGRRVPWARGGGRPSGSPTWWGAPGMPGPRHLSPLGGGHRCRSRRGLWRLRGAR